jgi:hypothetical protein
MTGLEDMTTAQLIERHNARCARTERIAAWKASKAKLIAKIEALGAASAHTDAPKAAEKSGAAPKATIGDSVRRLLLDGSLSYAEIVKMVKAAHPEAATTSRSIASVACAMRKGGTEVPMRRAEKGAAA